MMSLLFCAGLAWVMDLIPLSHPGREAEPERGIHVSWGRQHPRDLDEADVARFLSDLAVRQLVSASIDTHRIAGTRADAEWSWY